MWFIYEHVGCMGFIHGQVRQLRGYLASYVTSQLARHRNSNHCTRHCACRGRPAPSFHARKTWVSAQLRRQAGGVQLGRSRAGLRM